MDVKSQNEQLIELMQKQWISPLDALAKVGCMRLAARVLDIKNQDYMVLDRWADNKKFKEYRIARGAK
jgi:hypothetical protein